MSIRLTDTQMMEHKQKKKNWQNSKRFSGNGLTKLLIFKIQLNFFRFFELGLQFFTLQAI